MKRLLCGLIISLLFTNLISASAINIQSNSISSPSASERAPLQEVLSTLESEFSNAEVHVEGGVINVFLPVSNSANIASSSYDLVDRNGGTWDDFKPPFGTPTTSTFPYACIYLPKEKAAGVYFAMTKTGLIEFVVGLVSDGISYDKIAEAVKNKFKIDLHPLAAALISIWNTYEFFDWLDLQSFENAYDGKNPVRMMLATNQGWPLNVYSKWDGVNVNPHPYSSWKPVWNSGVYVY